MTILILAGTGEARSIAQYCADQNIHAQASLAGVTRQPSRLAVETRHGGFGGADGFRAYLKTNKIRAIVDATHPFASHITRRSFEVAQEMNLPLLRFDRPQWEPKVEDNWIILEDETHAALHITPGSNVFLATGRQSLPKFANLAHARLICRQIDPPDAEFPWPNGQFLIGHPPFSITDEEDLFRRLGVDVLVVKNAGGTASRTKLDAARILGVSVLMIARPAPCGTQAVQSLLEVEQWLQKWQL
jgi:precorrin-6A/cobalt-precorrin-6A reductase